MTHGELLDRSIAGEWASFYVTIPDGSELGPRVMLPRGGYPGERWRFTDRDTGTEWFVWPQDVRLA